MRFITATLSKAPNARPENDAVTTSASLDDGAAAAGLARHSCLYPIRRRHAAICCGDSRRFARVHCTSTCTESDRTRWRPRCARRKRPSCRARHCPANEGREMTFMRGRAVVVDRDRRIDERTTAQHPLAKTTAEIDRAINVSSSPNTKCERDIVAPPRISPEEVHRLASLFADLLMADLARHPPQE